MEVPAQTEQSELAWEEIRTEHILQNRWVDFRSSAYRLPDGRIVEPFYSYSRRDYVVVVASDTEGRFLCVRQFRHGIRAITTEFPAGGIERGGDRDDRENGDSVATEEALAAARRELLEETGYSSDDWSPLLAIPSHATISDNYAFLFRAKNCRKVASQELDATEFLEVETYAPEELDRLVHSGGFQQAVHVMGWLLAKEAGL